VDVKAVSLFPDSDDWAVDFDCAEIPVVEYSEDAEEFEGLEESTAPSHPLIKRDTDNKKARSIELNFFI